MRKWRLTIFEEIWPCLEWNYDALGNEQYSVSPSIIFPEFSMTAELVGRILLFWDWSHVQSNLFRLCFSGTLWFGLASLGSVLVHGKHDNPTDSVSRYHVAKSRQQGRQCEKSLSFHPSCVQPVLWIPSRVSWHFSPTQRNDLCGISTFVLIAVDRTMSWRYVTVLAATSFVVTLLYRGVCTEIWRKI